MPNKIQLPILRSVKNAKFLWIARYASVFARHNWGGLKKVARQAGRAGISSRELYELTLQGYLFLGFPAVIEALGALDGIVLPAKKGSEPSVFLRVKKGRQTCRRIYREKFPALMENLSRKSPALAGWVIEEGYGKVLSRAGASLRLRELFTAALLSATGFSKQLFAHLRALVALGEKPEALELLVKKASRALPARRRGKVGQALKLLHGHKNTVWEAPVFSL